MSSSSSMASPQDSVANTNDQKSTVSGGITGEGGKPPSHALISICKSLVAGGVAGGVSVF
jgi:hypothetical protein